MLEFLANFKTQLIQKNRLLSESNFKLAEITKELKKKDERIFEFENQLMYYKTMTHNDRYFLHFTIHI